MIIIYDKYIINIEKKKHVTAGGREEERCEIMEAMGITNTEEGIAESVKPSQGAC